MSGLRSISTILAAVLLVLMLATLDVAPRDHSTVGDWLRSPARGASHPRPFPLDFYRTPRGLAGVRVPQRRERDREALTADEAAAMAFDHRAFGRVAPLAEVASLLLCAEHER